MPDDTNKTTVADLIERVARAIFTAGERAFPDDYPKSWEEAAESDKWCARVLARAAIEEMTRGEVLRV